jgi:hypothetical protein
VIGLCGEALRELGRVAQFVGGDFCEDEPVVPLAASLLQAFESGGEAAGFYRRFRGGLGKIAGELGAFADLVSLLLR